MRILHNSREKAYRDPYGAVQLGGTVTLSVDVYDDSEATCTLRLWLDGVGESLLPMRAEDRGDHLRFSLELTPEKAEIHWYSFIVEGAGGTVKFLGAPMGRTGGEGVVYDSLPPSFQITVYKERRVYPEWWEHAIVYQIFPDRFNRGSRWKETVIPALERVHRGPRRRLVEDWNAPVSYEKNPDGTIAAWDFYGGTLDGIAEKLDYLSEMGVTALYLNPIFIAQSNHRYDTADYLNVSPILGGNEAFQRLAMAAAEHGISIVLDGVFNHTGTDSVYFNELGNFPSVGAGQSPDSPYHDWYEWRPDGTYASWWGVKNMPAMNKGSAGWREFVFGEDGVVPTWLRRGARGWRLDVADELNDDFIAHIKEAEAREMPDALLLGEVWEDASNKIAYSELRHYFCGDELDGVMNYPFRDALLEFLRGTTHARDFVEAMESLHENYPPHSFASSMNLLGSHDRARLLTLLALSPDPDTLTDEEKRTWRIPEWEMGAAKGRMWCALLLQMAWPGPPCLYYGDEAGLQGMTDPYNRATFPWGGEDPDTMNMTRNALDLRLTLKALRSGMFRVFSWGDDVVGVERRLDDEAVVVLVNRSRTDTAWVELEMLGEVASELVGGQRLAVSGDGKRVTLPVWPLASAVVLFHPRRALAKELERGSGVFCAITSVPKEGGPGTLGEPAKRFVDYLARAGQSYWQILPVNPVDAFGSPYSGSSAFAGNVALIDTGDATLAELVDGFTPTDDFVRFCEHEAHWLDSYAAFESIRELMAERGADAEGADDVDGPVCEWARWPEPYRRWSRELLRRPELAERIRRHRIEQYLFQSQWDELHAHAERRGVRIIGDMPFYVSGDSADTWAHPEIFTIAEDGRISEVGGCPPDSESPEGQVWGSPTYDWRELKRQHYQWWVSRLGRALSLYDCVRLDHFIGFSRFWSIPAKETADRGRWLHGPGVELFETAYKQFGPLPIIAEDLGYLTPAIRALVKLTGFMGQHNVIFADTDVRETYVPPANAVAYTSTHDTTTLVGWVEERFFPDANLSSHERARHIEEERVRQAREEAEQAGAGAPEETAPAPLDIFGGKEANAADKAAARELAADIANRVLETDAPIAIQQLQDVLLLDGSARMNTPGTAEGNWRWQATADAVHASSARLLTMTARAKRLPEGFAEHADHEHAEGSER